ncbi:hypothetical protein [Spiroplasma endosymbiont of Clivina fossor]|uniref:hypothetical protein n=1 Tax=Spiroplasma endosymbiont of Clivina fossor TaxID=3066282 RepID=UPI00313AF84A
MQEVYYIYDFIDEITRIVFGYVYDSLGTNNAINAVQRAMKDFSELGITIKRLRTDNAPEFTTTNWSNKKAYKVKERPFTAPFFQGMGLSMKPLQFVRHKVTVKLSGFINIILNYFMLRIKN